MSQRSFLFFLDPLLFKQVCATFDNKIVSPKYFFFLPTVERKTKKKGLLFLPFFSEKAGELIPFRCLLYASLFWVSQPN